jgi:hypothetical protein
VDFVLRKTSSPETEIFFTTAWKIWANRNATWLNNPQISASTTSYQAVTYVEEYIGSTRRVSNVYPVVPGSWSPPAEPFVKLNVTWKYFRKRKTMGVGSIARDHTGAIMGTFSAEIPGLEDGLQRAALSLVRSLQFGHEADFQKLVVEFSHTQLGPIIMSIEECLTELEELIVRIRTFQSLFSHLIFRVVPGFVIRQPKLWHLILRKTTNPRSNRLSFPLFSLIFLNIVFFSSLILFTDT